MISRISRRQTLQFAAAAVAAPFVVSPAAAMLAEPTAGALPHVPADYSVTVWIDIDSDGMGDESYRLHLACHDGRWSMTTHVVEEMDQASADLLGIDIWDLEDIAHDDGLLFEVHDQVTGPDPLTALLAFVRGHAA